MKKMVMLAAVMAFAAFIALPFINKTPKNAARSNDPAEAFIRQHYQTKKGQAMARQYIHAARKFWSHGGSPPVRDVPIPLEDRISMQRALNCVGWRSRTMAKGGEELQKLWGFLEQERGAPNELQKFLAYNRSLDLSRYDLGVPKEIHCD